MAIDLCIEGSGWVIHAIDGASNALTVLRRFTAFTHRPATSVLPCDRAEQTRRAASQLPIDQAQAIWLVDVCGYSYSAAADVIDADHETVAARVSRGRQNIRQRVYGARTPCAGDR